MKGFLIAGTASGVGKTTVTLAILAAMRRRGLTVQPFKGGPDFLDTGHHTSVAGRTARNLDTWMLTKESNGDVLREASQGADLVVVEGMMGLFDGKNGATECGSSAEIAKLFQLPVVLLLDAAKSARSIAAVVLGFERFDPKLKLAGVILNRAASERHFQMLATAINTSCDTPVLGWLPRNTDIAIAERHLGLKMLEEVDETGVLEHRINILALLAEQHLKLDALASLSCGFNFADSGCHSELRTMPPIRVGLARDPAFNFYYEDNFDLLRRQGAEIVPFSPIGDTVLPESLDALYFGGGYPELYARELSGNQAMLNSIRLFADSERPIYAECGGMVYLSNQLTLLDGHKYAMAGVLPITTEMTDKLVKFGYVTVVLTRDCLLGAAGTTLKGHSFHYSRISADCALPTSYRISYSLSNKEEEEGFCVKNILASYIHVHFRTQPDIAQYFLQCALIAKAKELTNA
jgi:cobyrinic acid a,c-diamide synthase